MMYTSQSSLIRTPVKGPHERTEATAKTLNYGIPLKNQCERRPIPDTQ